MITDRRELDRGLDPQRGKWLESTAALECTVDWNVTWTGMDCRLEWTKYRSGSCTGMNRVM